MIALLGIAFWGIPAVINAAGPDPTGTDTLKEDPNAGVNIAWTLVTGFLVFFMQLGFALLGAGLIRATNTVNYLTKSYMDFCIAALGFWAFGFALMFGGSKFWSGLEAGNSAIGYSGFFLTRGSYDVTTIMAWFFQMAFAATATTIVAGAVADRMKTTVYLTYSFIVTWLIYSIYGHWMLAKKTFGSAGVSQALRQSQRNSFLSCAFTQGRAPRPDTGLQGGLA
jgi:Amt family ammonium transporter